MVRPWSYGRPVGCRKASDSETEKVRKVSLAKKDFLTVAKITRSDQIIRDFAFTLMARFDAPSNDQINPALAR